MMRKRTPKQTPIPMENNGKRSGGLAFSAAVPALGCARVRFPVHLAPFDLLPASLAGPLCWAEVRASLTPGSFEMSPCRLPDLPGADLFCSHFQAISIHPGHTHTHKNSPPLDFSRIYLADLFYFTGEHF